MSKERDKLYEAVTEYLEANGGKAILGAGIFIQPIKAPDKAWDEFYLRIKICGKKPKGESIWDDSKFKSAMQKNLEEDG